MAKEHPIVMSSESIMAIQAGRKTQTRRVIVIPKNRPNGIITGTNPNGLPILAWGGGAWNKPSRIEVLKSPYQVGDLLWVKETFARVSENGLLPTARAIIYKASKDEMIFDVGTNWKPSDFSIKWRSSRYMPKACARLWLEITGLRVERVQDITIEDIKKEGLYFDLPYAKKKDLGWYYFRPWRELWDSLNAKRGFGWDKNPWVWVIEIKRYDNA